MIKVSYLSIDTWRDVDPDARHYYGTLQCDGIRIDLLRPYGRLGVMSKRFSDKSELIEAGKREWKIRFSHSQLLVEGGPNGDPPRPIEGPADIVAEANKLYNQAKNLDWDVMEDINQLESLYDEWTKLIEG